MIQSEIKLIAGVIHCGHFERKWVSCKHPLRNVTVWCKSVCFLRKRNLYFKDPFIFYFTKPTKQMLVFFPTRLKKSLIYQKTTET